MAGWAGSDGGGGSLTQRLSRAEIGNAVFACLTDGRPTIDEGVAATGLSYAQWRTGLQYVRDTLSHNPAALTYDATQRRYYLDVAEVPLFIALHIRQFTQRLRLLYDGCFVPASMDAYSPQIATYRELDSRVATLLADLETAVSDPEARMSA